MQEGKQTLRLKPSPESKTSKPNGYINEALEPTATQAAARKKMELSNRLLV